MNSITKTLCRLGVGILAAALLLMPVSVAAEDTTAAAATTTTAVAAQQNSDSMSVMSKIYSLNITDTEGAIELSPNTPAAWECPILRAGEDFAVATMIVRNDSDVSATMAMNQIALPYGDQAKMNYLNYVMLTIYEDTTVLYNNSYAHINDADGGFTLKYTDMAPGEEHIYTIKMRCLYAYPGDPYEDASVMTWDFVAQRETTVVDTPSGLPLWMQITVAAVAAVLVLIMIIMIVRAIHSRRHAKVDASMFFENPEESDAPDEPDDHVDDD